MAAGKSRKEFTTIRFNGLNLDLDRLEREAERLRPTVSQESRPLILPPSFPLPIE